MTFQVSGIYPLHTDVFQDSDFSPGYVTDRPEESTVPADAQNEAVDDTLSLQCEGKVLYPRILAILCIQVNAP